MTRYHFDTILLPGGWADSVQISVDATGNIADVSETALSAGAIHVPGVALPGMPNLHSHAFQRALAGLAEHRSHPEDSFWSWRELMYQFVEQLTPEQLHAIAAQLYLEMLKAGYTSVAEFHYVHHDPLGHPYDDSSIMSQAIIDAAQLTGIALTHLPVLYMSAGFGRSSANTEQRRFVHGEVYSYLQLVQKIQNLCAANPQLDVGIAPHSLRAVPEGALIDVVSGFSQLLPAGKIHIHIAEQLQEVNDCLAHTGMRPVQWLQEKLHVDERWCLVHATHLTDSEVSELAGSGAVAGLCPTTEANLGDGLFPLPSYLNKGGVIGVGSDSNSSVSPVEELRWLEYGQRLIRGQRNVSADSAAPHVGCNLWQRCCAGGAQALGKQAGAIAPGYRADLIVLDPNHPTLVGRQRNQLLDSFIFSGNSNPVTDVISGGRRVVENGRHPQEEHIGRLFRSAMGHR